MTPPIEPTELQELVNKNIEQIKETLESEEDQISKYEARISENESQIAKDKAKSIENDRWFNLLGLSSGIMAALIAIASLHGSKLRNEASMNLGNSLFYWNLAEGASIKYDIISSRIIELKANHQVVAPVFLEEIETVKKAMKNAKNNGVESYIESLDRLKNEENFARAEGFLAISLSLSGIAAVVRKKTVWYVSIGLAFVGLGFFIFGMLPHNPSKPDPKFIPQLHIIDFDK